MLQLTCSCLNVSVHINEGTFNPLSAKEKKEWFPFLLVDDAVFQGLAPVTLALGGISKVSRSFVS